MGAGYVEYGGARRSRFYAPPFDGRRTSMVVILHIEFALEAAPSQTTRPHTQMGNCKRRAHYEATPPPSPDVNKQVIWRDMGHPCCAPRL